mmetsp:Transcript_6159/g.15889  ORF Transcript_6159/g.15889 Transcript_6159/m.15889 type:complete len:249 (-) Transcript_6159:264-1010(-)
MQLLLKDLDGGLLLLSHEFLDFFEGLELEGELLGETQREAQDDRGQRALQHAQVVLPFPSHRLQTLDDGVGDHKGAPDGQRDGEGLDGVEVDQLGEAALAHDRDGLVHATGHCAHVLFALARKLRNLLLGEAHPLGVHHRQAHGADQRARGREARPLRHPPVHHHVDALLARPLHLLRRAGHVQHRVVAVLVRRHVVVVVAVRGGGRRRNRGSSGAAVDLHARVGRWVAGPGVGVGLGGSSSSSRGNT